MENFENKKIVKPIEDLDLSTRTFVALKNSGILTLEDITSHPEDFFTPENIPGFNNKSLEEIKDILVQKGMYFREE